MTQQSPVLEMEDISVAFPGVNALDRVTFRMFPGEVHSLLGENGAGKSTLIKAMTGAIRFDSGELRLFGEAVRFASPVEAQRAGISAVYQEVNLIPTLSVGENIMLGREARRGGSIDWKRTHLLAAEALEALNVDIDPRTPLSAHSFAVQQLVAIARTVAADARIVVLDEPTSSLDNDEVTDLFRVIRAMKEQGVAVLFVSHFLEQVYEISDRLTVLRDGRLVGEYQPDQLLRIELVQKIVGRDIDELTGPHRRPLGDIDGEEAPPLLEARQLRRSNAIEPFDLEVHEGEVIGVAGLLGSGRTELARLLAGADQPDGGSLVVENRRRRFASPRNAIRAGVIYSPENRAADGILPELTIRENIVLSLQSDRGWFRPLSKSRQTELARSYIESLHIRPADPEALAGTLSGGNQQKVLLARWLAMAPKLLILDEPTRGVDIGAKVDLQRLVLELAANGMGVMYISAELEEVLRLGRRIVVLRDRELVADIANDGLTIDNVLALIAYAASPDGMAGAVPPASHNE
ncbi:sugar ABC transporter ATP-binding protein [Leifsonia sp. 1010]|uniref:sugar ABC transporter ATP-binding protein n=1 Tax=Leifsonia sp. 1010 TaxID=2817769 RepID=UPI00285B1BC2|nr:sugar ABC transporter ATP-binding protein [Leifsonia sp. 1010]MDR6611215.1 simple sugar transport system ATP-binding protein [Leifsonia sp. 1010]